MKRTFTFFLLLMVLGACKNKKQRQNPDQSDKSSARAEEKATVKKMAQSLEETHHTANFKKQKALHFDVEIDRNGQKQRQDRVSFTTDFKRVKIRQNDGTVLIYNHGKTAVYPPSAADDITKADLWKWVDLFALPYRLADNVTRWGDHGRDSLNGKAFQTLSLRLKQGNKSTDLKLYTAKTTDFLSAVVYKDESSAPVKKAQLVRYDNYFSLGEFPIAKYWDFYQWEAEPGRPGKKIARATLSKVRFFDPPEGYFDIPNNSKPLK